MTTTTFTEHPPVTQVLRKALQDYPELIARLKELVRPVKRRSGVSRA